MKNTISARLFCYREIEKRMDQLDIQTFPTLVFTRRDWIAKPNSIGRRNTSNYYGVCDEKHNMIFLNIKHFKTRGRLRETIIHELVHLRFPYLQHGREFKQRMENIMKGKPYPRRREQ